MRLHRRHAARLENVPRWHRMDDRPISIAELAGAWLAAENAATASGTSNLQRRAVELSQLYEAAVRTASRDALWEAWEAAAQIEETSLVGTVDWTAARRVTELLRSEYHAAVRDE